jgi:SAM-dependent methyltransferase
VETLYYWPEPLSDMREILRVLKPGGQLVVIAETYKGEHFGDLSAPVMKMLRGRCSSVSEHRELFSSAGFSEVAIHEQSKCGWLCGVGRKPLASTV